MLWGMDRPPKRSSQQEKRQMTVTQLIHETREWRAWYKNPKGGNDGICAAACVIREQALIDAMNAKSK